MPISRREFIAASSAFLTLTACGGSVQNNTPPVSSVLTQKGIAGAAPSQSNLVTSWYYNWGANPSTSGMPATTPSMSFFPMVWGWYPKTSPTLLQTLSAEHLSMLLGFNEPDNPNQSNIPVATAIAAWPQLQGIAKELVSPAPADPLGTWMETFMNAIEQQNLQCDAVAVHSYGGINSSAFLDMLDNVYTLYQRPIYVTEFAVADYNAVNGVPNQYSVQQVSNFMETVCPAMDNLSYVKGYAWYPWPSTNSNALASSVLFNTDGSLTALGLLYSQLSASTTSTTA